ncbi:MAG: hypothetical protein PHU69_10830 [Fermentimonas sp.]|nr:hypothetical protein [Fermentimonas sp.]
MTDPNSILFIIGNGFDIMHGVPSISTAIEEIKKHNLYWDMTMIRKKYLKNGINPTKGRRNFRQDCEKERDDSIIMITRYI